MVLHINRNVNHRPGRVHGHSMGRDIKRNQATRKGIQGGNMFETTTLWGLILIAILAIYLNLKLFVIKLKAIRELNQLIITLSSLTADILRVQGNQRGIRQCVGGKK
jgi:uncharacterized membrane protein